MNLTLELAGGTVGVEMRPLSIKLGEQAERQLSEIQDHFAPFVTNRSQTLRLVVSLFHTIVSTPGVLAKLEAVFQELQYVNFVIRTQGTHEFSAPHRQAEKPGPVRMETEGKPRRSSVNSTYRLITKVGAVAQFHRKDRMDHAWRITSSLAGVGGMLS